MWQNACHIWKYYIIKCYKMLVILHIRQALGYFYENDTTLLFSVLVIVYVFIVIIQLLKIYIIICFYMWITRHSLANVCLGFHDIMMLWMLYICTYSRQYLLRHSGYPFMNQALSTVMWTICITMTLDTSEQCALISATIKCCTNVAFGI